MTDVQAHTARLIALFVSCILYGVLLTTFVPSIRSLLCSPSQKLHFRRRQEIKFPIVAATTLMFLVSSFSAVLSLQDVIDAFVDYKGSGVCLGILQHPEFRVEALDARSEDTVQVILGDALLIYRCYVLYDRSWRAIALPTASWIAMAGLSITSSYREANLEGTQRLNDASILPVLSVTLFLTFTTSVVTTYLIVRRLFTVRSTADMRGTMQTHFLTRVGMIFFETGVIYTLSVIASLGVYLSGSNLQYVASLALIHIIPITCNLLLIRVEGINRGEPHPHAHQSNLSTPSSQGPATEGKFNPKAMEEV